MTAGPKLPLISVIIPAYNEEKLIAKCLTALQKQTYPKEKIEVIVVDNGSKDKTSSIAREIGYQTHFYDKMHVVSAVRNYGISKAKGEILAFIDSDTIASKEWLASIVEELREDSLVGVTGVVLPDSQSVLMKFIFWLYDFLLRIDQLFGVVMGAGYNMAIKRSSLESIGGFDPSFTASDDCDIILRLQKKFGNRSVRYSREVKVYSSTRKYTSLSVFIPYVWSAILVHVSVLFLRRVKKIELINVR